MHYCLLCEFKLGTCKICTHSIWPVTFFYLLVTECREGPNSIVHQRARHDSYLDMNFLYQTNFKNLAIG